MRLIQWLRGPTSPSGHRRTGQPPSERAEGLEHVLRRIEWNAADQQELGVLGVIVLLPDQRVARLRHLLLQQPFEACYPWRSAFERPASAAQFIRADGQERPLEDAA